MLFGSFGDFETRVLLSALTITVTSILGLMCGAKLEASGDRILPLAGIVFTAASAVMWIYQIWNEPRSDVFVKTLMSVTLLAAACGHISLLTLARLDRRFIWARHAAWVAVWALTAYLLFLNDVIPEDQVLDKESLPKVRMPIGDEFGKPHEFRVNAPRLKGYPY